MFIRRVALSLPLFGEHKKLGVSESYSNACRKYFSAEREVPGNHGDGSLHNNLDECNLFYCKGHLSVPHTWLT